MSVGEPAPVGTPTSTSPPSPLVHYHAGIPFSPLQLHMLQGKHVRVNTDRTVAVRLRGEFCNGFVFSCRPIRCGETIVIQVLGIDRSYIGGLGFGLTACDPATVEADSLPDDSDLLLDRLEYWVVNKDVCRNPEVGDELSFCLTEAGEVKYARNNQNAVTLMHVDRTLPLWAFFDVYGNIQKIKVIGTVMTPVQGHLTRSQSLTGYSIPPMGGASLGSHMLSVAMPPPAPGGPSSMSPYVMRSSSMPGTHPVNMKSCEDTSLQYPMSMPTTPCSPLDKGSSLEEEATECKVCCEFPIDCVLYTCGHMCMCFKCANLIKQQKGVCPICRHVIKDVIKAYRS